MNHNLRFTASFATILLLGMLAFTYQSRHLDWLRSRSDSPVAMVRSPAPSQYSSTSQEVSAATLEEQHPAAVTADPVAEFIDTINEKLVTLIKPESLAKILGDRTQLERISAVVKLTDEERISVQKRLAQFDLAKCSLLLNPNLTPTARAGELAKAKQQKDDWFSTRLGKMRSDQIILSNQLHERAVTERRASLAVSRMSETLDLSDEQREQLQVGLVERDLKPLTQPMLAAKFFGTMQTEPPVPDLSEEAEDILSPAQWQAYQKQGAINRQKDEEFNEMAGMMTGLLPTLFEEIFKN